MKKIILIVFLGLIACVTLFAQTRPIMGYDQVAWGVSANEVRRVYNLGDLTLTPHSSNPERVTQLIQENVSNSIKRRTFMFIDDKLYRVVVRYNDTSDATATTLRGIIENNFGRQTDSNIQTGNTALGYVLFTSRTYIFGQYSPELVVEVIHTRARALSSTDFFALAAAENENSLRVEYNWKRFRDEYQASRLGL